MKYSKNRYLFSNVKFGLIRSIEGQGNEQGYRTTVTTLISSVSVKNGQWRLQWVPPCMSRFKEKTRDPKVELTINKAFLSNEIVRIF